MSEILSLNFSLLTFEELFFKGEFLSERGIGMFVLKAELCLNVYGTQGQDLTHRDGNL